MEDNKDSHTTTELLEFIIERQRLVLVRIVESHEYNFLNQEVIAASMEMDYWLNFYQQNSKSNQDKLKESNI
jgi:hypothetical protein